MLEAILGKIENEVFEVRGSVFFICQVSTLPTYMCESNVLCYMQGYVYILSVAAGEEGVLTHS